MVCFAVQGGVLSKLVTDEELTAANVLAVKTLVNVTQAYPGVSLRFRVYAGL